MSVLAAEMPAGSSAIHRLGFPKSERGNIDKDEEEDLKTLAKHLLSLSSQAIAKSQEAGELIEVTCDEKD